VGKTQDTAVAERPTVATEDKPPLLVMPFGRQTRGKTALLRYLGEFAERKRKLEIIDADPNAFSKDDYNRPLSFYFKEAEKPPAIEGEDKMAYIEKKLERQMDSVGTPDAHDILLDVGGNDLTMKRSGREANLIEVLQDAGVVPVVIHMLGPDIEDLSYVSDIEEMGLKAKVTILMINAGLVPATSSLSVAFKDIIESDLVKKLTGPERGAKLAVMPALGCMREINSSGLHSYRQAFYEEGAKKIGRLNVQRVRNWLADMGTLRASLAEYLP
jgi:hypothetical protein